MEEAPVAESHANDVKLRHPVDMWMRCWESSTNTTRTVVGGFFLDDNLTHPNGLPIKHCGRLENK